jgi:N-acetylmuramoyl-L-alanine amidase
MEIKQSILTEKHGIKCPFEMAPQYITIHNTANDAPAANEIAYMKRNNYEVSFHIAVDDTEAIQAIPFNRNAWHASDGHGSGNRKSIAIEICYSKSGGAKYEKAVANALEVTAQLMKQFNVPASKIMYHKNWSGKNCPHRLLADGITVEKYRELAQAKYNELYEIKSKSAAEVAKEVIAGKWGNGEERKQRLTEAGYNYSEVQSIVNELVKTPAAAPKKKSNEEIAQEVIQGKWGNGAERKQRLAAAGYNYAAIQKIVNNLLK